MTQSHTRLVSAAFLSSSLLLASCAVLPLRELYFSASINANQNQATSLDIVWLYDNTINEVLPHTSSDWFLQRSAILDTYGTSIEVISLEIPPGTAVSGIALPSNSRKAVAVRAYANYTTTAGQQVLTLGEQHCGLIELHETDWTYTDCEKQDSE